MSSLNKMQELHIACKKLQNQIKDTQALPDDDCAIIIKEIETLIATIQYIEDISKEG